MKLRLFITLLLGCISLYGYTAPKMSDLEEFFPIIQEFPKCEDIDQLNKNALPREIVSQSLLQIKNLVEYRNGLEITYNAIGRISYNSNEYLIYEMTNGYEYEIYMSVYSDKNAYPLTLTIYRLLANRCEIEYFINDGIITIVNVVTCAESPALRNYVYKLDSSFSEIKTVKDFRDNDELEIIPEIIP